MKKIKYIIIALIFLLAINVKALDTNSNVHDYGLLFSNKQEQKINKKIENYKNKHDNDMDIQIVTVQHKSISDIDKYMDEYYKKNIKEINKDAILFVVDLENDGIYAKAFGNPIEKYNTTNIKKLLKESSTKTTYYKQTIAFINSLNEDKYIDFEEANNVLGIIIIVILSLFISTMIIGVLNFRNKRNIEKKYVEYLNMDTLKIIKREDSFKTTHTKKIRK